ncbi:MAG: RNA polymerase, partial [Muribaculaceae bacterium]|nr:RNA polymerase [Muribaculaceae bacterium]
MTDKERQIERLFRQHYRAMYRLASILLHDDDESKDVVHDVFARLLVGKLPMKEDSAKSYLLSCVRNQCLNVIRNRKVQERVRQLLMLDDDLEDNTAEELERVITILQRGIADLYPP